jgi:VanZ family protein
VRGVRAQSRSQLSRLIDATLWAASLGLLVMSFLFSWGSPPGLGPDVDWIDKLWHFLGYGALCTTLLLAAVWRPGRGTGRFPGSGLRVAGLVLATAWITEALQAPFGRDTEVLDAVADLAGVAFGFLAWRRIWPRPRGAPPQRPAGAPGAT